MKKYISVFLAIACIFMMAGCTAKNDEKKRLPELGDILQYTEDELKEIDQFKKMVENKRK